MKNLKELKQQILMAEDGVNAVTYLETWLDKTEEEVNRWAGLAKTLYPLRVKIITGIESVIEDAADGWADKSWPDVKTNTEAIDYHKKRLNQYRILLFDWVELTENIAEYKALMEVIDRITKSYKYQIALIKKFETESPKGLVALAVHKLERMILSDSDTQQVLTVIRDIRKLGVDGAMEVRMGNRTLYDDWEDLAVTLANLTEYWKFSGWAEDETVDFIEYIMQEM